MNKHLTYSGMSDLYDQACDQSSPSVFVQAFKRAYYYLKNSIENNKLDKYEQEVLERILRNAFDNEKDDSQASIIAEVSRKIGLDELADEMKSDLQDEVEDDAAFNRAEAFRHDHGRWPQEGDAW